MKLGYDLTIEQSQKLVMTPELIQAIQILQFNTQELESYVEEQLLTNPILEMESGTLGGGDSERDQNDVQGDQEDLRMEEGSEEAPSMTREEFDWLEHFKERQYDDISYLQNTYDQDKAEYTYEQFTSSGITLSEHLMFQLQFTPLKQRCRQIGRFVIESLDENGYLTQSAEELANQLGVSTEEIHHVLDVIHGFDPAGVGAADLKECLIIQLEHLGMATETNRRILRDHIEDIAGNRLNQIAKACGITVLEVQEICDLIRGLEPKPGRQFSSGQDTRYIVPDVTVEKIDGVYTVTVNDSTAPRLMLSNYYKKMLMDSEKDSTLSKFLTGRLNSALWLIKSIEQRRQTIYNVVKAVVKYQEEFFEHGAKHLHTLTLKQIAEEVGIHESTVSRSINGKYMQSPRGVFEIKYFFTSGVSDNHGQGIASESIKQFIQELVDGEDPAAPLSDQAMVDLLSHKGIDISRRTVAKYRDEINVPSSSKRKRFG